MTHLHHRSTIKWKHQHGFRQCIPLGGSRLARGGGACAELEGPLLARWHCCCCCRLTTLHLCTRLLDVRACHLQAWRPPASPKWPAVFALFASVFSRCRRCPPAACMRGESVCGGFGRRNVAEELATLPPGPSASVRAAGCHPYVLGTDADRKEPRSSSLADRGEHLGCRRPSSSQPPLRPSPLAGACLAGMSTVALQS